jgi:hypothetical protein
MNNKIKVNSELVRFHSFVIACGYSERKASILCNRILRNERVYIDWENDSYEMLDGNTYEVYGTVVVERDGEGLNFFDYNAFCRLNEEDDFTSFDTCERPDVYRWSLSYITCIY